MYAKYVVFDAVESIEVSPPIQSSIKKNMDPPFDELFDEAEEHVLKRLLDPWKRMLGRDADAYSRVSWVFNEDKFSSKNYVIIEIFNFIEETRLFD